MKELNLKKIYSKNYFILIGLLYLPLLSKIISISYLYNFTNALKIFSQIALLNIIFKCFEETFFNPLFKVIGANNINEQEHRNFISKNILVILSFFTMIFSIIVILLLKPIMKISCIPTDLFKETYNFFILYSITCSFKIISKYLYTITLINNNTKEMFFYLLINIIPSIILLTILVPKFSFGLGVIGIAITEITVSIISIIYLSIKSKNNLNKTNVKLKNKEYFKLCFISFLETTMRNVIYYFVILVMLNKLNNQDLYFVANEYIWTILLIPTLAQSNLIKQNFSNNNDEKLKPYFINSIILILIMAILLPFSLIVFKYFYQLPNYMDYFYTLLKLSPCYILFVFDSVIEAYFLTKGKLKYILFQGILTNIGVYLFAYILYLANVWTISLNSIILIFNLGVIISSLFTIFTYILLNKKSKTNELL